MNIYLLVDSTFNTILGIYFRMYEATLAKTQKGLNNNKSIRILEVEAHEVICP